MEKILLIEKNASLRRTLYDALSEEGYDVIPLKSLRDSVEILEEGDTSLTVVSLDKKSETPFEAINLIADHLPTGNIILILDREDVDDVVEEVKEEIYDYLTKPVDLSSLKETVANLFMGDKGTEKRDESSSGFFNIIGKSKQMAEIYDDISRISKSDASVLITGESGTGKELVASAIHNDSGRSNKPFIKVHSAALAEGVLESELFGHEKGAFTDAIKMHRGKFEQANGGTLFLDEISEIPLHTQVKLLRILEDGVFERVGGSESIRTNIRLITATNRNLDTEIREGRFREDLYWRIRVIEIEVPPLRERVSDIPLLIEHFIEVFNKRDKKRITGISDDALEVLKGNPWYGNVRELRNAVEHMVVMAEGDMLEIGDIPTYISKPELKGTAIEIPVGTSIEEAEKVLIRGTLMEMGGDKERTAKTLGITVRELLKLMNRYKLGSSD